METFYLILALAFFALLFWIFFYLSNSVPLTSNEIHELAKHRRFNDIIMHYGFQGFNIQINPSFKKSLNVYGGFYNVTENLNSFPSLIASLLKGKKHEWVIVSFVKKDKVLGFWANKGIDNQSVSVSISKDRILSIANENKADTIIMFHNHTNAVLESSEADITSSISFGKEIVRAGYNFLAFVVARGGNKQYAWWVADNFKPINDYIDKIEEVNGSSKSINYNMSMELRRKRKFKCLKLTENNTSNNIFN